MKKARIIKRLERLARQSGRDTEMNIVSLIDIFAILVFYLLVNALVVEILPNPNALKLPESVIQETPRENTLAVYRTGRSVWRLELGPALVVLVESLAYGATLADALGKVEPLLTGMPEAEAGALVMGWFQTSVSSGLFSALKAD